MRHSSDVLVVGAGPAGSVAALVLARAGARVRVLDRARFPRDKLCGDTLSPGTLAVLRSLAPDIHADVLARGVPIAGMMVTGPGAARVVADYPPGLRGVALPRRDLDDLLIGAAIRAGAQFDDDLLVREPLLDAARVIGARAIGRAGECRILARVVIAADGRTSRMARALALSRFAAHPRRWAFGAYFSNVAGMSARGEMHVRRDGYVGIAPLPGGIANVCVVRERHLARISADDGAGALDVIDAAIAGDPALRARFRVATRITTTTTLGPLAVDARASGCDGLLLAGDAAGFVDPMTGDGLRFALRGGELAGQAAAREIQSGNPAFAALAAARRREFASKWRFNRALRRLAGAPRGVAVAAGIATIWPASIRYLIGIAGDLSLAERDRLPDSDPHARAVNPGG